MLVRFEVSSLIAMLIGLSWWFLEYPLISTQTSGRVYFVFSLLDRKVVKISLLGFCSISILHIFYFSTWNISSFKTWISMNYAWCNRGLDLVWFLGVFFLLLWDISFVHSVTSWFLHIHYLDHDFFCSFVVLFLTSKFTDSLHKNPDKTRQDLAMLSIWISHNHTTGVLTKHVHVKHPRPTSSTPMDINDFI